MGYYSHLAVSPLAIESIQLSAMKRETKASDVLEGTLGRPYRCSIARVQVWVGSLFPIAVLDVYAWLFVAKAVAEVVSAGCLLLGVGSLESDCRSSFGVLLEHRCLPVLVRITDDTN